MEQKLLSENFALHLVAAAYLEGFEEQLEKPKSCCYGSYFCGIFGWTTSICRIYAKWKQAVLLSTSCPLQSIPNCRSVVCVS